MRALLKRLLEKRIGQDTLSRTLARSKNMQLPWIGFRIFKWLLGVIALFLILLVVHASRTYPTPQDLVALGATTQGADRIAQLQSLRSDWLSSVKDLGQTFIFTPFFPLLGAVVGYIFGVSRQQLGGEDGAAKDGSPPGAEAVTSARSAEAEAEAEAEAR